MGNPGPHFAISAKTRAMYGKGLREADFTRLMGCKSLGEALIYLKSSPGWGPGLQHLPPRDISRTALEEALRAHLTEEAAKLYRFAAHTGSDILPFPLYRYELDCILWAFRKIQAPQGKSRASLSVPDFFRQKSKLDFAKLATALHWRDIVQAGESSIYNKTLENMPLAPETGRPEILALDLALLGTYYSSLHRFAKHLRPARTSALFRHSLGTEADLTNLSHILRLKSHFPHMLTSIQPLLIPFFYKLKPAFFQRLAETADRTQIAALLDETLWCLEKYNRNLLLKGSPSPYIPAAYLHVKGRELKRLIQGIEDIYYRNRRAAWQ